MHDAKVALGERGLVWWVEDLDPDAVTHRIRCAHRAIRRARPGQGDELGPLVAAITSRPPDEVDVVLAGG